MIRTAFPSCFSKLFEPLFVELLLQIVCVPESRFKRKTSPSPLVCLLTVATNQDHTVNQTHMHVPIAT